MSGAQIFFACIGLLFAAGSLVMALARTRPKEAASALSEWVEAFGLRQVPGWLRNKDFDVIAQKWAGKAIVISLLAGILGFAVWYWSAPTAIATAPSPHALSTSSSSNLPPIPKTDSAVHGWLKPANYQTPPNGCTGHVPDSATKVLIGNNAAAIQGFGKLIILEINGCAALSIERAQEGVLLSATVSDGSGIPPAKIENNEIVAENGDIYSARQSPDESTLIVTRSNAILLEAEFLNTSTIRVKGMFGCAGGPTVPVTEDRPTPGIFMSNSCAVGAHAAFAVKFRTPTPSIP